MGAALPLLALGLGVGLFGCLRAAPPLDARSQLEGQIPAWAARQGFAGNRQALVGARLFVESGCLGCHTYLGGGSANLGAPDLTAEGAKGKGIRFQTALLRCPSCVRTDSAMPPFAALGPARLRSLAVFLEASKGTR